MSPRVNMSFNLQVLPAFSASVQCHPAPEQSDQATKSIQRGSRIPDKVIPTRTRTISSGLPPILV